mgnify:CR=1 FL=1
MGVAAGGILPTRPVERGQAVLSLSQDDSLLALSLSDDKTPAHVVAEFPRSGPNPILLFFLENVVRSMATASPSRAFSFCGSSATGFVTTTRGSCSQTLPSATPSCPVAPRNMVGKRCAGGRLSDCVPRNAPSSAISARTMATTSRP